MSLEEKLRTVIAPLFGAVANSPEWHGDEEKLVDEVLDQIIQAFKDEGWRLHLAENVVVVSREGYMTGQEWYDRFEKEMEQVIFYDSEDRDDVTNAAKKAAGL